MKKEFSTKPEAMTEQWPGELTAFSWYDSMKQVSRFEKPLAGHMERPASARRNALFSAAISGGLELL